MNAERRPRADLTPPEAIFSAYDWSPASPCYRCGRDDVETAAVGRLTPERDDTIDVLACPSCVLVLEHQRETAALRYGWPYQPGTLPDH